MERPIPTLIASIFLLVPSIICSYAQEPHFATPVLTAPDVTNSDTPLVATAMPVARTTKPNHTPAVKSSTPATTLKPSTPIALAPRSPDSDDSAFQPKHRNYPWKAKIFTTIFWIGEGGSSISSTTNYDSAWVTDWSRSYGGNDNPNSHRDLLPEDHAALCNPFYVALPFNDLAFPEKAARWLPAGWSHPVPAGQKQISACKDRWVEIRNSQGRSCYAQWEDVGPLRFDHAEYVFGDERPNTYDRAGLDVSPAVATYLGIDGKNCMTSWRFVDAEDVPTGVWLKYEEEAILLVAMRGLKDQAVHLPLLPGQTGQAPIEDSGPKKKQHKG